MSIPNIQVLLESRPQGELTPSDFKIVKTTISKDVPNGHILVRNLFLSIDPTMRNWMSADPNSYHPPVEIGQVFRSLGVGEVLESKSPKFKKGEIIFGMVNLQEFAVLKDDAQMLYKIPHDLLQHFPMTSFVSVFGMPALTAYFGMTRVAEPREGETVLISGAAGFVGSIVGQIAKIKGCRVVGIAGSDEKCKFLVNELQFDAAINYKKIDESKKVQGLSEEIRRHCPKGVDVYWDNVGGEVLDAALENINLNARIVMCGAISEYNVDMKKERVHPLKNYLMIFKKRARMQGILVTDYFDEGEFHKAMRQLADWVKLKKAKHQEEVVLGLERAPEALQKLFRGTNVGKVIVQITRDLPSVPAK